MIRIKDATVSLHNIHEKMLDALVEIAQVYAYHGVDCVITSCNDGQHSRQSWHYRGRALDFRTRTLDRDGQHDLFETVTNNLGPDYDVILEPTHLHVEYDPK